MLNIQSIEVSFSQPVLRGVNLELQPNVIHGLLGKNGAGKTTLFKTIFGLIPPSNGTITCNLTGKRRDHISLLESEPYFYPYMTGKEYLMLLVHKADKIDFWNELFELPLDRYATEYSTGMKKKLVFMGLLLKDKPIWLLDEPFNGVDFETNEKMSKIIQTAAKEKTILISSHILDKLTSLCDTISVLEAGKISHQIAQSNFDQLAEMLRNEIDESIQNTLDQYKLDLNP